MSNTTEYQEHIFYEISYSFGFLDIVGYYSASDDIVRYFEWFLDIAGYNIFMFYFYAFQKPNTQEWWQIQDKKYWWTYKWMVKQ